MARNIALELGRKVHPIFLLTVFSFVIGVVVLSVGATRVNREGSEATGISLVTIGGVLLAFCFLFTPCMCCLRKTYFKDHQRRQQIRAIVGRAISVERQAARAQGQPFPRLSKEQKRLLAEIAAGHRNSYRAQAAVRRELLRLNLCYTVAYREASGSHGSLPDLPPPYSASHTNLPSIQNRNTANDIFSISSTCSLASFPISELGSPPPYEEIGLPSPSLDSRMFRSAFFLSPPAYTVTDISMDYTSCVLNEEPHEEDSDQLQSSEPTQSNVESSTNRVLPDILLPVPDTRVSQTNLNRNELDEIVPHSNSHITDSLCSNIHDSGSEIHVGEIKLGPSTEELRTFYQVEPGETISEQNEVSRL